MKEDFETTTSGGAEEWDMSGVEFMGEKSYDPEEYVRYWGKEYAETERQFRDYRKGLRLTELDAEERRRYEISLKHYEEDAALDLARSEGAAKDSQRAGKYLDVYAMAELQGIGRAEPKETIEAATAIFYDERREDLRQKIESAGEGEKGQEELAMLGQTWAKVREYMDAVYDQDLADDDYETYDYQRRLAHNAMIRHLNSLNDLAREYGTTPFTFRNFLTNDFHYEAGRDPQRSLDARVKYDRYTVVGYFEEVFKKDFDRREKMRQQRERWFGRG